VTTPLRSHNRHTQRNEKDAPADVRPMRPTVPTSQLPAPPTPVPPFDPNVSSQRTACSARRQVLASAAKTAKAGRCPIARPGSGARLVAAAAVTLIVVSGLGWIGHNTAPEVPANTAVVQVGAGETLWDIARRVAPQSDPRAVVERIQQLNQITGSAVSPGQWLQVPDSR
jgi:nucleoid-associated protein YgaU